MNNPLYHDLSLGQEPTNSRPKQPTLGTTITCDTFERVQSEGAARLLFPHDTYHQKALVQGTKN